MNNCPLCRNSAGVRYVDKHNNYDILFCADCGIQFSDPMEDHNKELYEGLNLYKERAGDRSGKNATKYDWRYEVCLSNCTASPNQSVLDIGCGEGKFLAIARQRKGLRVFGIDLDERAINTAKNIHRIDDVKAGGWEKLREFNDMRYFNMVTLFDVLEHLADPTEVLKKVYGILHSGGNVCISVPRLDRIPGLFDYDADFPPHHFTIWTGKALMTLLKNTGFVNIEVTGKPLLSEDILFHLVHGTKKYLHRLGKKSITDFKSNATKDTLRANKMKKPVFIILTIVSQITAGMFTIVGRGRGGTLFVTAQKP